MAVAPTRTRTLTLSLSLSLTLTFAPALLSHLNRTLTNPTRSTGVDPSGRAPTPPDAEEGSNPADTDWGDAPAADAAGGAAGGAVAGGAAGGAAAAEEEGAISLPQIATSLEEADRMARAQAEP